MLAEQHRLGKCRISQGELRCWTRTRCSRAVLLAPDHRLADASSMQGERVQSHAGSVIYIGLQLDTVAQAGDVGGDEPAIVQNEAGHGGVVNHVETTVQVAVAHIGAGEGQAQPGSSE
jgi:hypothetical protein